MTKDEKILFQTFPELDWILDLTDDVQDDLILGRKYEDKIQGIHDVYWMLTWSRRHALIAPKTEASGIAFDLLWKYNRRVFSVELQPDEQAAITRSIKKLKVIRE